MASRQTRQRELILEVVRSTMDHPTADWVYRHARHHIPRISLGTVYRNLKRLAEQGVIREIHTGGHPARFDGNTGRHYHIRCLGCGRVNDLPMSVEARFEEEAGRAMNFRVLGHQLEVQGLCPLCQALEPKPRAERDSFPRSERGVGAPLAPPSSMNNHSHQHPREGRRR